MFKSDSGKVVRNFMLLLPNYCLWHRGWRIQESILYVKRHDWFLENFDIRRKSHSALGMHLYSGVGLLTRTEEAYNTTGSYDAPKGELRVSR
jgi:hypothetical protein